MNDPCDEWPLGLIPGVSHDGKRFRPLIIDTILSGGTVSNITIMEELQPPPSFVTHVPVLCRYCRTTDHHRHAIGCPNGR